MKIAAVWLLALGAAWGLEAVAALTQAPLQGVLPARATVHPAMKIPALSPVEAEIVRDPFAPSGRRDALRRGIAREIAGFRLRSLLPAPDAGRLSNVAGADMGWALPDRTYWKSIPQAA